MRRAVLISIVVLFSAGWLSNLNAQNNAGLDDRQKQRIVKKLRAASPIPIHSQDLDGSPLHIQEATVREISGDDLSKLAGEAAKHPTQATYPEVTLLNTSEKTIKAFAVMVQSSADRPDSWYGVLKRGLSITPNAALKVTSPEWLQAERVHVHEDGKFVNRLRQLGLDSPKSWLPGAASNLRVIVGMVEFDDGTKWTAPPGSN